MTERCSLYESAVRRLRNLRVSGECHDELERIAKLYHRNIGIDPHKALHEAAEDGPTA